MDHERALGELTGKVDGLIAVVERDRRERREWEAALDLKLFAADGVLVRHSRRLGALERWHARSKGALWAFAVVWGVLTAAIAWLTSWWPSR